MEANNSNAEKSCGFFEGTVLEAVQKAKISNMLIVVALHSENAECQKMDKETWGNADVNSLLTRNCVALKLQWSSADAKNFYSIYPVLTTPTIYFIQGTTGVPLKILTGFQTAEQFTQTYNQALQATKNPPPSSSTPSTTPASTTATVVPEVTPTPVPIFPTVTEPQLSAVNPLLNSLNPLMNYAMNLNAAYGMLPFLYRLPGDTSVSANGTSPAIKDENSMTSSLPTSLLASASAASLLDPFQSQYLALLSGLPLSDSTLSAQTLATRQFSSPQTLSNFNFNTANSAATSIDGTAMSPFINNFINSSLTHNLNITT